MSESRYWRPFLGVLLMSSHPPWRGGRAAVAERVGQWTGEWKVPRSRRGAVILKKIRVILRNGGLKRVRLGLHPG